MVRGGEVPPPRTGDRAAQPRAADEAALALASPGAKGPPGAEGWILTRAGPCVVLAVLAQGLCLTSRWQIENK